MPATAVLPEDADLPGRGWMAIDDGFSGAGSDGPGALIDCVGPAFPEDAIVDTAASPHFVRPPGALIHALGVSFDSDAAADDAAAILSSEDFAACLGRSVAADLAGGATDAEFLGVDVVPTIAGHRAHFAGGDDGGVRSVHLDIVCIRVGRSVGVLWCGDTGTPFPADDLEHVVRRIGAR